MSKAQPNTPTCKMCTQPVRDRRIYCSSECFRQSERNYSKRHRATFSPQRRRAYDQVYTAIQRGKLLRQPCEVCGNRDAVAHHDDYAAPLDVRWLCLSHHQQHHIKFGPGKNAHA